MKCIRNKTDIFNNAILTLQKYVTNIKAYGTYQCINSVVTLVFLTRLRSIEIFINSKTLTGNKCHLKSISQCHNTDVRLNFQMDTETVKQNGNLFFSNNYPNYMYQLFKRTCLDFPIQMLLCVAYEKIGFQTIVSRNSKLNLLRKCESPKAY